MSKNLDEIDLKILAEIQADGRITNVELAKRVGISPPPCLRRVRTLEEEGYILGYRQSAVLVAGSLVESFQRGAISRAEELVRAIRAVATGHGLPRRLSSCMQQRLDLLSTGAGEVVRVAAVLPDRFSAGLLAAMLERQPASLMSAVEEAVRADLLVEDEEQLRFRHDLLREATRQSLTQSLRRAMERDGIKERVAPWLFHEPFHSLQRCGRFFG